MSQKRKLNNKLETTTKPAAVVKAAVTKKKEEKPQTIDSRFSKVFNDDDYKIDEEEDDDVEEEEEEEEEEEDNQGSDIEEEDDDDDDDEDNEDNGDEDNIEFDDDEEDKENEEKSTTTTTSSNNNKKTIKIKPMDIEKMKKLKEENENKGIIYLSTIPPRMKPAKLKQLLLKHGQVTRMYLVRANVERKSHRNDMFQEGWIEFQDKSVARKIATLLSNTPMGGKSRDIHRDCLWNLRYLPKFKWHHLQDKLVSQRMERDKKLKLEINQVRKQNMALLEQVERSKHIHQKQESKPNKNKKDTTKVVRTFKQRSAHEDIKSTISSNVLEKVVSNKRQKTQ